MKRLTRIVAWIYIMLELPAMLVLAVMLLGGGFLTTVSVNGLNPLLTKLLGLGMVLIACLLAGILLLQVLPWIYLLKKREWAWWLLVIVFIAAIIACFFPVGEPPSPRGILVPAFTLVVLLLDAPDKWKAKRKAGRRPKSRIRRRPRSR